MPKVVFVYDNYALAALGASVVSMTSVDTDYPAANAINTDRRNITRTIAPPATTVDLQIDLGQNRTVTGFGVHGFTSEAAVGAKPSADVRSGTSASPTTVRASCTTTQWDTQADWVDEVASHSARYINLHLTSVSARVSVAQVIVGISLNMAVLYKAGSSVTDYRPGRRERTVQQDPVDAMLGNKRRMYRYGYRSTLAQRTPLRAIAGQAGPFSMLDADGFSNHCVMADPISTTFVHVFDPIYDVELNVEQLVS